MASVKKDLLANIVNTMRDRTPIRGESGAQQPAVRPSLERQGDGRRRLDSGAKIRVDRIVADPNQPRTEFDQEALQQLAASLKERGQLQPVRVRWDDSA